MQPPQQIQFISPVGSVGGDITKSALDEALTHQPHLIAWDTGTTDAGPFSLGMGIADTNIQRALEQIITKSAISSQSKPGDIERSHGSKSAF